MMGKRGENGVEITLDIMGDIIKLAIGSLMVRSGVNMVVNGFTHWAFILSFTLFGLYIIWRSIRDIIELAKHFTARVGKQGTEEKQIGEIT